ncbi:EscI/YscI/HrpB family type III secretion system inner rod protein [Vibrio coralliilyticus]|uniref:EscI/YscI/HrpB family type III secretion system inner rod protein n=1 Tax=Vibrio coralliilyticus TaxID=190893 RepID=UPI0017D95D5B|nr:EscI/YscI/HrpB family type III secretion system inner rod protein [Vibrio coralliilyticus]NUW68074.1 EscI/YscI/HrpB family type III secretion system inner rod protein [Vibrio coralliilyticus]
MKTELTSASVSVMEEAFNNVGEGFEDVLKQMEAIQSREGNITITDTLNLQQSVFKYGFYQETVTKIASKSATAINEVMKAQ